MLFKNIILSLYEKIGLLYLISIYIHTIKINPFNFTLKISEFVFIILFVLFFITSIINFSKFKFNKIEIFIPYFLVLGILHYFFEFNINSIIYFSYFIAIYFVFKFYYYNFGINNSIYTIKLITIFTSISSIIGWILSLFQFKNILYLENTYSLTQFFPGRSVGFSIHKFIANLFNSRVNTFYKSI